MRKLIKLIVLIFSFVEMLYYFMQTIFSKSNEKIWLFVERGDEAKDNAYYFYNFIVNSHSDINSYYIIDQKSADLYKFKCFENIVQYKSKEHKKLFLKADKIITTHVEQSFPWDWYLLYPIYNKLFKHNIPQKLIWLRHGIGKDDLSPYLNTMNNFIDLMVTATKSEYESIVYSDKYLFSKEQIALTGLARFDNLNNFKLKNQLLVMPTWRMYLSSVIKDEFVETDFFKRYKSFLSNPELKSIIVKNNFQVIFYLHYRFQKYCKCFKEIECENIKVISMDKSDVQTMLKESRLLITDYSSVFFDFAYMIKPTIFYQFDQKEFRGHHYKEGYFDYYSDAFGPILLNEDDVVDRIKYHFDEKFIVENEYHVRIDNTFEYFDKNNCNRIYTAVNNI